MPTADHDRPAKRQRVTQACQRCRGRKFRCDGGSPSCGACITAQATCSYDTTSGRQRGLKSGYVKVLESLWGSVFLNVSGSERVVSQLLAGFPANAGNTADDAGGDEASPLQRWRASSIPEAIRALLDGRPLPALDGPGVANTTWTLPSSSSADNVERNDHAHALPLTSSLDDVERYDVDAPSLNSLPSCAPNPSSTLASGLPDLPQDWQTLVQVYLCTEYCCLPMFEKACPYRWAYRYQDHANISICNLESSSRGQYATLWAILVLGELHLNGAKSPRLDRMKQSAKVLLATTESVSPDQTFSYAFLLWSLVYTGHYAFTLARMMLAQAMVLADVHDDMTNVRVNGGEALLQAGCFVMETILALATGARMSVTTVDADAVPSGDVGEWDPFINALEQGQSVIASNTSPQLPPSRTGSTFKALVKLMTMLKKASHPYSNLEALTPELRAWEASLPADLRAALIAEATSSRTPVPSQLNLQSWYHTLWAMIARPRQGVTGSAAHEVASDPALQGIRALHTTESAYGLSMLSSTSSIILLQISQLSAGTYSSPDTVPIAHSRLATLFSDHWGWSHVSYGVQQNATRNATRGSHIGTHQSGVPPSLTEGSTSGTTGLERQEPTLGDLQYTAGANAGSTMQPGLQVIGDANETHPLSQRRLTDLVPAPSVDPLAVTNVDFRMEDPVSYDLLEYLTMFENNNWYVEERPWLGLSVLNVQQLTVDTAMTGSIWSLSGTSVGFTTLLRAVMRSPHDSLGTAISGTEQASGVRPLTSIDPS
jgi:hypothetical protein